MYKVVEIKVFGMLAGYKVVDKTGRNTGFEYGEDEKYKAESRVELMNELRKQNYERYTQKI